MRLLATERSLLQRTHYKSLLLGRKTPKIAQSSWDFVTLPEKDRGTAVGNTHRKISKDRACDSGDILVDRQTHRHTHRERERERETCSLQLLATAPAGEVILLH